MSRPSQLALAKRTILSTFNSAQQNIYSQQELGGLLVTNREAWNLANRTSVTDFISFLQKQGRLHTHEFRVTEYNQLTVRYSWGKASLHELALTLKRGSYLSHGTAAALHGLSDSTPKTIHLNVEQSAKESDPTSLTQERIKSAFSRKQRQSRFIYAYKGSSIILIAGKNTNRLGVEPLAGSSGETLQVTNLERTLIDLVVRPTYAGGMPSIFKAYKNAKDRVSADKLLATLKRLDYVYPYNQAIGFLMQRAGFPQDSYVKFRSPGLEFDFYLAHGMQQSEYSQEWRLYYPRLST